MMETLLSSAWSVRCLRIRPAIANQVRASLSLTTPLCSPGRERELDAPSPPHLRVATGQGANGKPRGTVPIPVPSETCDKTHLVGPDVWHRPVCLASLETSSTSTWHTRAGAGTCWPYGRTREPPRAT